jgi:hypothetical protein
VSAAVDALTCDPIVSRAIKRPAYLSEVPESHRSRTVPRREGRHRDRFLALPFLRAPLEDDGVARAFFPFFVVAFGGGFTCSRSPIAVTNSMRLIGRWSVPTDESFFTNGSALTTYNVGGWGRVP